MAEDKDRDAQIRFVVDSLFHEFKELGESIKKMELRRARIRAALIPLMAIEDDEPAEFSGTLADACRFVLQNREGSLSPPQVRDAVKALGYDLAKHDNVMAAIHGVLKSLVDQDQVKTKTWKKEPGVTRYYWTGNLPEPSAPDVLGVLNLKPPKFYGGGEVTLLSKLLEPKKDGEKK